MPKHRWRVVTTRILDVLLGALFVYAGGLKAWDPVQFARDIDNYHAVPWTIAVASAFYLPWLEIACGVALIVRRAYAGALSVVSTLLVVFIIASVAAKARGIDISCGCFGHLSRNFSFTWHLVLDFALLAAVGLLWRDLHQRRTEL